jgi:small-conductance mechanosensitive channel
MAEPLLVVLAVLGAAFLLHWAIGRASRRLPVLWARRRGLPGAAPEGVRRASALARVASRTVLWLAAAFLLSERSPALHGLREGALGLLRRSFTMTLFSADGRDWSLLDLMALPALVAGVWLAASLAVRGLRARILVPAGVEDGLQETLSLLLRYGLLFLGVVVLLTAWGVDLRSIAIGASVLGVGIGFGLQNIANNFVSGLLINLERPVRPGDFVHVGDFMGRVLRVGARSTQIRTTDRVTILVPNSRFLETEVVNWSHGDPLSRLHVAVGVAYGSDLERVRKALLEAASGHPQVVRDPRPQVWLRRFGESSLDFELLVWTRDPENQSALVSDLNFRVAEALARHGIQIPFPQRDLHLRSPALERVVGAWSRRTFRAEELDGEQPAGAGGDAPTGEAPVSRLPSPWSEAQLEALAARMAGPGGVEVRDRRHLLSTYPRCFVGQEAVSWLVEHEGLGRGEAVELGQRLVALGIVRHVLDEHGFHDGHFFYRFRSD